MPALILYQFDERFPAAPLSTFLVGFGLGKQGDVYFINSLHIVYIYTLSNQCTCLCSFCCREARLPVGVWTNDRRRNGKFLAPFVYIKEAEQQRKLLFHPLSGCNLCESYVASTSLYSSREIDLSVALSNCHSCNMARDVGHTS